MQELDTAGLGSVRVTRQSDKVVILEKDLVTEQMVLAMGPQHPWFWQSILFYDANS